MNVRDMYRWTPLHYAARTGNIKIVKLLLKQKADVNNKDHVQRTPRDIATEANLAEIAEILVDEEVVAKTVAEFMKLVTPRINTN